MSKGNLVTMLSRRQQRHHNRVKRTAAHVLVSDRNKLYMWGGYMECSSELGDATDDMPFRSYNHIPSEIWVFDLILDYWYLKVTTGSIPVPLSGACAEVYEGKMYLAGGYCSDQRHTGYNDKLWQLDLKRFTWQQLEPEGHPPSQFDKSTCWMYKGRLYVFGGFGPYSVKHVNLPVSVSFVYDETSSGDRYWTDQLCYYDIDKNEWVWPRCTGKLPIPRAAHAAALAGDKAFIFGGRYVDRRIRDFRCLDLTNHHWTVLSGDETQGLCPEGRSWHTLNALSDTKLILYAGFSTRRDVFNDIWIYDIPNRTWALIDNIDCQPRLWHKAVVPSPGQFICVGGIANNILQQTGIKRHVEEMLFVRFSPPPLRLLALEYICKHLPNNPGVDELPYILSKCIRDRLNGAKTGLPRF